jgi:putative ABC transport system permease protein
MILSFQTDTVRRTGHLAVFGAGYFDFGVGNPGAFGISGYQDVMALIEGDPVLKPLIVVMTPSQAISGIAGNYADNRSKTFFGEGIIPSSRFRMRQWDEYGVGGMPVRPALTDEDAEGGVVGAGLARILGLCAALDVTPCPTAPKAKAPGHEQIAAAAPRDFSLLVAEDRPTERPSGSEHGRPQIDLLAATAGDAPNVVSLNLNSAVRLGLKDLEDNYVAMNLAKAQQLLYGRGEHKVSTITLQLRRTEDLAPARARLESLVGEHQWDLEVRDFRELTPLYDQALSFFLFIFSFIAAIIAVIVLFTIVNTMGMSVMERTNEIGTVRALGVQRRSLRWQFVAEGCILGAIGAALGAAVAGLLAFAINHSGVTWSPPNVAGKELLHLYLFRNPELILGTWAGLVAMSILAALIPASRAAKMPVVDALRHV